jgi:hypothetical protein
MLNMEEKGGNMFVQWTGWLRQERLTSQWWRGSVWHDCVGPEKGHNWLCHNHRGADGAVNVLD